MSIKHKLRITFIAVAIVPMILVGTMSFWKAREALTHSTFEGLHAISEFKESEVFYYIENLKTRTMDFSSDGLISVAVEAFEKNRRQNTDNKLYDEAFFVELLSAHLRNKKQLDKNLSHMDLLSLDGKVIASSDKKRIGQDRSKEKYFISGKENIYIKDLEINTDEENGTSWSLTISAPIMTKEEPSRLIGVIANHFDATDLNKIMTGQLTLDLGALTQLRGLGKTGETFLVNKERLMLNDSLFIKDAAFKQRVDTFPVEKCLKEDKEVVGNWIDYRGIPVAGSSMCITLGDVRWTLITKQDEAEALASINGLRNLYIIVGTITLFIVGLIATAIARSISDPINSLKKGSEIIGNGDLDHKVGTGARDEVGQLSREFDRMTEKLKTIMASRDELENEIKAKEMAEAALRTSEAQTRTIMDTAIDGIITIDEHGICKSFNQAASGIFGYNAEEVIGKNISMLMPEPYKSEHDRYIKNYISTGIARIVGNTREAVGLRKDSTTFPITLGVSELRIDNKILFTGIVRDITEIRKAEKMLKDSQIQLFQSEKMSAVGTMVAGVAHELNNPMMGLLNYIQYCHKRTAEDDKRYTVLEDAIRETHRCIDIVQNLLTFARMEKEGEEGFNKESCAVVLERVLKLLSYRIGLDGVSITHYIAEETPEIWMRANSIQQVFFNLITNALDAVAESPRKDIHIDIRPEGENVIVTISDSGNGIDQENLQKIFEAFYTTKPVGKGTGLGLSMSHSIVNSHGGVITCESSPEMGTNFIIQLPIERRKKVQEAVSII